MKKIFILLVILFLLPVFTVSAQMAVIDAALNSFMQLTHLDQIIVWIQEAADQFESLIQLGLQVEHLAHVIQMTIQNLQSLEDIDSWEDFKDFYNRQLYMEAQVVSTFKNLNVNIGKKNYSLFDLKGMAAGAKDTYIDYWNKEFTEDQRREMWMGLGLTPSNYAFVKPIREKANELTDKLISAGEIQNSKYMANMTNNMKRKNKLVMDQLLGVSDKMGEKQVSMMMADTLIDINTVLNEQNMLMSDIMGAMGYDRLLLETPQDQPAVSSWWDDEELSFPNFAK